MRAGQSGPLSLPQPLVSIALAGSATAVLMVMTVVVSAARWRFLAHRLADAAHVAERQRRARIRHALEAVRALRRIGDVASAVLGVEPLLQRAGVGRRGARAGEQHAGIQER